MEELNTILENELGINVFVLLSVIRSGMIFVKDYGYSYDFKLTYRGGLYFFECKDIKQVVFVKDYMEKWSLKDDIK